MILHILAAIMSLLRKEETKEEKKEEQGLIDIEK